MRNIGVYRPELRSSLKKKRTRSVLRSPRQEHVSGKPFLGTRSYRSLMLLDDLEKHVFGKYHCDIVCNGDLLEKHVWYMLETFVSPPN